MSKRFDVLFLCDGDPDNAVLAASMMNKLGQGHFRALAAARKQDAILHPATTKTPEGSAAVELRFPAILWSELSAHESPAFDFVFLLVGPGETREWPRLRGQLMLAQWHVPAPIHDAIGEGVAQERLRAIYLQMLDQIEAFIAASLVSRAEVTL